MYKNFDLWNVKKKGLENLSKDFLFKTGDVWWCSVGININIESCGKGKDFRRPVLILKKLSHKSFIGIPLTTQIKKGSWFVDIKINEENCCALIYQIRMFSVNRLQWRLAKIDLNDFVNVKEKLKRLLELF